MATLTKTAAGKTPMSNEELAKQIEALQAQMLQNVVDQLGDLDEAAKQIAEDFEAIKDRAEKLKLVKPGYNPPWTPQAMRRDMRVKAWLIEQGQPKTVAEIADGTQLPALDIEKMLKPEDGGWTLFKPTADGKWWVKSKSKVVPA